MFGGIRGCMIPCQHALETLFSFGDDGAFFSFVDGVLDVYHLGSQALLLPFECFPLLKERNGRGVKGTRQELEEGIIFLGACNFLI
jgi:hypothetical protein